MKLTDYISQSIQHYPSLYKDVDYEKSKLKVLDQVFFVNGNGLELAQTENPLEGGYIVSPKYKKRNGDYERINDKPYGKEKFKKLPENYFESVVYYVSTGREIETIFRKGEMGDSIYFRYTPKLEKIGNAGYIDFNEPRLMIAESKHEFSPYSISKGYAIAADVFYENIFLQLDWLEGLIFLCERTLEYFQNENKYVHNHYYPTERSVKYDLNYFEDRFKKEGLKGLNNLQKTWSYEVKDEVPTYDEIKRRKGKSWADFHESQLEFLTKAISEFKQRLAKQK